MKLSELKNINIDEHLTRRAELYYKIAELYKETDNINAVLILKDVIADAEFYFKKKGLTKVKVALTSFFQYWRCSNYLPATALYFKDEENNKFYAIKAGDNNKIEQSICTYFHPDQEINDCFINNINTSIEERAIIHKTIFPEAIKEVSIQRKFSVISFEKASLTESVKKQLKQFLELEKIYQEFGVKDFENEDYLDLEQNDIK